MRAITLKPHKHLCLLALGIVVLTLCLIAPESTFGEASPVADPDFAAIDVYIQKEVRELHVPGLTLGIVHDGEVVHLESFGEADPSG